MNHDFEQELDILQQIVAVNFGVLTALQEILRQKDKNLMAKVSIDEEIILKLVTDLDVALSAEADEATVIASSQATINDLQGQLAAAGAPVSSDLQAKIDSVLAKSDAQNPPSTPVDPAPPVVLPDPTNPAPAVPTDGSTGLTDPGTGVQPSTPDPVEGTPVVNPEPNPEANPLAGQQ